MEERCQCCNRMLSTITALSGEAERRAIASADDAKAKELAIMYGALDALLSQLLRDRCSACSQ